MGITKKDKHEYKGGRLRPENAEKMLGTARGICVTCSKPKKQHFA